MIHYLSLSEIAGLLGKSINTMKAYHREGRLPPPDATVGRNRGWLPKTIKDWDAARPGQGARTDLSASRPSSTRSTDSQPKG